MSFANEKANHAIECHVTQCNNHCGCADYCSLDKVCIGTHECDPFKCRFYGKQESLSVLERDFFALRYAHNTP